MSDAQVWIDGDNATAEAMAKEIAGYLVVAYPGPWMWSVEIKKGSVIIKNTHVSAIFGMHKLLSSLDGDAARRKHDIIMAAGELLEAARLSRKPGAVHEGEYAQVLEGIDKKDEKRFKPVVSERLQ